MYGLRKANPTAQAYITSDAAPFRSDPIAIATIESRFALMIILTSRVYASAAPRATMP